MFLQHQSHSSFNNSTDGKTLIPANGFFDESAAACSTDATFVMSFSTPPDDSPQTEGSSGDGLEDVARDEHEYLRGRLRDELKREPTEEELNEWLRQHTEGY